MRQTAITVISTLVIGAVCPIYGQQIEADITVHAKRLEPTYQNTLQTLQEDLEEYVNNYEYTDNTYNTTVPMIVQIYVQQANESGTEISFSAQLLVTNGTDQRYFDKSWEFPYSAGNMFQHGSYHPITGVIDFYAYILLAGEVDTYAKLGGTPYYNSAQEIANQSGSSGYNTGWRSRLQRLNDLQDHRKLRLLRFTFYDAYWDLQESSLEDARAGLQQSMELIREILGRNRGDKYTKIFLDGNVDKFGWLAQELGNTEALQTLTDLDPDNKSTYQSYLP